MKKQLLYLILLVFSIPSFSQYKMGLIPRQSPLKELSNTIGYTQVKIKYSSPAVRDRKIWGDLVPYDEIWRAGANEATKLSFSKEVKINGHSVPAGNYAIFMIPRDEESWTIIFNNIADQWGAFNYDMAKDLLRTEINPVFNVNYQEDLKYEIIETGYNTGLIRMLWENIELDIEFSRNVIPDLIQNIETTADATADEEHWVVYLQGAEFLLGINKEMELANEWLHLAESLFKNSNDNIQARSNYYLGHLYWLYSKYYKLTGNQRQAMNYWIKMKTIDKGNGYYSKGIGPEKAENLKKEIESD